MIKINSGFDTVLDAAGKTLEVAPKIYDDAIQPAAQESGKILGLIPRAINAALVPMRQWIAQKEYNIAKTEKLLAYKLANLEPEKIVPPEPYVAVPALQAISYSMNNDELRNLYANLLAKSMNIDTKDSVHPAFVEIIKQLSPFDAEFLKKISNTNSSIIPKVKIRFQESENNGIGLDIIKSIIDPNLYDFDYHHKYNLSIDNLERLKLIHVDDTYYLIDDSVYSDILKICNIPIPQFYQQSYKHVKKTKGSIHLTEFGKNFISTVIE